MSETGWRRGNFRRKERTLFFAVRFPTPLLHAVLAATAFVSATFAGEAPASEASTATRMAWFREAKFGLFIHWGVYSVPAGEWNGRKIPGASEWIMHNAPIPVKDYELLAAQFNPVKFDAEAWVRLAEDAGMKYIVITAKHHDGFAMYHSAVSAYNVYDATPFHRDPLRELADACARHKMPLGFYYSQAQDWHEPNGMGNETDFGPDTKKDFDSYLQSKAEPQVRELLTNYGQVALMWFDTPRQMTAQRGERFVNLVRSLQPACLIDGRLGHAGDYVSTRDNTIPDKSLEGDWETPGTTNHSWGYKKADTDWRSPGEILFRLIDIVSKGGNYLLNVGPSEEGVVPSDCQDNLRTVGRWLASYGEVVHGAGRSPFTAEYGEYSATSKTADGKPEFLERTDWRCTTRPGRLYFIIFQTHRALGFALPAFTSAIRKAYILGDAAKTALALTSENGVRTVQLPHFLPGGNGHRRLRGDRGRPGRTLGPPPQTPWPTRPPGKCIPSLN